MQHLPVHLHAVLVPQATGQAVEIAGLHHVGVATVAGHRRRGADVDHLEQLQARTEARGEGQRMGQNHLGEARAIDADHDRLHPLVAVGGVARPAQEDRPGRTTHHPGGDAADQHLGHRAPPMGHHAEAGLVVIEQRGQGILGVVAGEHRDLRRGALLLQRGGERRATRLGLRGLGHHGDQRQRDPRLGGQAGAQPQATARIVGLVHCHMQLVHAVSPVSTIVVCWMPPTRRMTTPRRRGRAAGRGDAAAGRPAPRPPRPRRPTPVPGS